MDTNAIAQALKDLDWTSVPVRNREAIEQAIVALDRGDPSKLVANDAAAAPRDERVEAAAIAMHAIRRDLAKGVGDLSFDMAFDTLPDEIKDVDRALARAAILAAFPVEQHEAAPVGLGWRVREMRAPDGTLTDCFVEAPAEGDMAYGLQVLGDDYTGYGDIHRKHEHCKMIVAWANAKPTPQHIFEYLNLLDRTEREVAEREARALTPAQPEPAVTDERAVFDYDDVVSICDAHGICLPVECVEMVVDIVKLSGLLAARTSSPNAAGAEGIAHEVWAAAQLAPGEGIEDGTQRIAAILSRAPAQPAVAWLIDWPDEPELGHYFGEEHGGAGARSRALGFVDAPAQAAEPVAIRDPNYVGGVKLLCDLPPQTKLYDAPQLLAIPAGYALVPIERSYDMRSKALIAFNTTEHAGKDRDDALEAAHRATIAAAPQPSATSPSAEG
ncbi:hypothetical protein CFB84_43505 [Burkholderia aenigmatica]|nr:hypothetical protein CFB84_43505 [Burkholderia aenigmatica]